MENKKWTWDPTKREVIIHENGDYMLGISETQYVTIRVGVEQRKRRKKAKEVNAGTAIQEEGKQEAQ